MEQQQENNSVLTVNSTVVYSMLHFQLPLRFHTRRPASKAQKYEQDVVILDFLLRNISPTYCTSRPLM